MLKINKKSLLIYFVICLMTISLIVGCGGSSKPEVTKPAENEASKPEESGPKAPYEHMAIAGGSTGSVFVPFAMAFADILNNNFDNINVAVEPGSSSANQKMIHSGDIEFSIGSTLQAYPGLYGLDWAAGVNFDNVTAIAPIYSYHGVFVVKANSPIKTIKDFEGKTVALGQPGSGSDVAGRMLMDLFGIKPKNIVNASWTDTSGMVKDNLVDVMFNLGGHPAAYVQEIEIDQELRYMPLSDEEMNAFLEKYPYYGVGTLKAGTYKYLTEDYKCFIGTNFVFADPNLPDDFIYNVLDVLYKNVDKLKAAHVLFAGTNYDEVKNINVKLHPGAEKYYKEKGVELPVLPPAPSK